MLRSLVVLLSLAAASASHRVHGNWEHRDDFVAAADEVLVMGGGGSLDIHEVVIAVEQQMLEQLSALTLAVSDPENAAYGKHLTYDQVHTMTANPEATRAVKARFLPVFWLLRMADWLQGPYFYEVYSSKVFNGAPASLDLVARLFLAGFATTALAGPIVGKAADRRGRKKGTLAFALLFLPVQSQLQY